MHVVEIFDLRVEHRDDFLLLLIWKIVEHFVKFGIQFASINVSLVVSAAFLSFEVCCSVLCPDEIPIGQLWPVLTSLVYKCVARVLMLAKKHDEVANGGDC